MKGRDGPTGRARNLKQQILFKHKTIVQTRNFGSKVIFAGYGLQYSSDSALRRFLRWDFWISGAEFAI